jgi:hypothetical protein
MTSNKEKPYISVAALCEHVLDEKDDVLSAIRLVDRGNVKAQGDNPPEQMPPITTSITALLSFKSGPAIGKRTITLRMINPSGDAGDTNVSLPVVFEGGKQGINIVVSLTLRIKEEGLYWIDVLVDDEMITRIPYEINYVQDPVRKNSQEYENSRESEKS